MEHAGGIAAAPLRRSDVQIELQWDPSVDERGIGVTVQDGVVTLVGDVPHYADKYAAENIAKRVGGVRAIANEIVVKIPVSVGFVSSWREKDDAGRAAWAAPGVARVENQLRVSYSM